MFLWKCEDLSSVTRMCIRHKLLWAWNMAGRRQKQVAPWVCWPESLWYLAGSRLVRGLVPQKKVDDT